MSTPRSTPPCRPPALRALGALSALLVALLAWAAPPAAAQDPDMNQLAISWLHGDWASPLVCEIGGHPTRGVRRLRIGLDSRRALERYARMSFFDLAAPGATRCVGDLGSEEPDLRGNLVFHLEASGRTDTALHDFKQELRREGGFEFKIDSGKLQLRHVGDTESEPRVVDFAGGTLRASRVMPGSDAARLLAEFPQPRKVTFEIQAPDGTHLRFPAVGH